MTPSRVANPVAGRPTCLLLAIALQFALPIVRTEQSVRAGFVVDLTCCARLLLEDRVPCRCFLDIDHWSIVASSRTETSRSVSVLGIPWRDSFSNRSTPDLLRERGSRPSDGRPLPLPAKPGPPSDTDASHGAGGSDNGSGHRCHADVTSLLSVRLSFDADLKTRLFVKNGLLEIEDAAYRFFRPPRASLL